MRRKQKQEELDKYFPNSYLTLVLRDRGNVDRYVSKKKNV